MKRLSATEARRNFFSLLDRAASGEAVLIERRGVVLQMGLAKKGKIKAVPDYRPLIHGASDAIDQWSWDWNPEGGLQLKRPVGKVHS